MLAVVLGASGRSAALGAGVVCPGGGVVCAGGGVVCAGGAVCVCGGVVDVCATSVPMPKNEPSANPTPSERTTPAMRAIFVLAISN
jgi:hypothetical protein